MSDLTRTILEYRELGTQLVDEWADHSKSAFSHFYDEQYTPEVAFQDVVKGLRLMARTSFLIGNEALEAVTRFSSSSAAEAQPFETPTAFTTSLKGALLSLDGDLTNAGFGHSILKAHVHFAPDPLKPDENQFKLLIDPGPWRRGILYTGSVTARRRKPDATIESDTVRISFTLT